MTNSIDTVRSLFPEITSRLTDEAGPGKQTLQQRLAKEIKGVQWTAKLSELVPLIAELLNIPLPSVLVAFWKKSEELNSALAESREAPGKPVSLWLADHTIQSEFKPAIEIEIGGVPATAATTIEFTIDLTFTLKGIVLEVCDGRIAKIIAGTIEVGGELRYKELVLAKVSDELSKPFPLLTSIAFEAQSPSRA